LSTIYLAQHPVLSAPEKLRAHPAPAGEKKRLIRSVLQCVAVCCSLWQCVAKWGLVHLNSLEYLHYTVVSHMYSIALIQRATLAVSRGKRDNRKKIWGK